MTIEDIHCPFKMRLKTVNNKEENPTLNKDI